MDGRRTCSYGSISASERRVDFDTPLTEAPVVLSLLLLGLMLTGGIGAPLQAQDAERLEEPLHLELLDDGNVGIHLGDILSDPALVDAVESGLPLRLEIVTQLWRDGFFDSQVGRNLWRTNVFYDALEGEYILQPDPATGAFGDGEPTGSGDPPAALTFDSMEGLRETLPRVIEPPIGPEDEGRYYYLSRLSVETLSLSDLEELRRWLRGDLAPAISGDGDVEGAAERGLRRTVIRLLGMPTRRFDARTPTFEHPPAGG